MMPSGYTCDFALGIRLIADCFMNDEEGLTPSAFRAAAVNELQGRLEEARGNPRKMAAIRRAIARLESAEAGEAPAPTRRTTRRSARRTRGK
jgi:hypothetical protein